MESSKHPLNWAQRRVLAPEKWQEMRLEGSLADFRQDCPSLETLAWFANQNHVGDKKKKRTCSTNQNTKTFLTNCTLKDERRLIDGAY